MAEERIVVRHFGPVYDLDIVFRPLTFFIGDQGSGKSTIAKLLTICRDKRWCFDIVSDNQAMIIKPFKEFGIDEYFNADTYIKYQHYDDEVEYHDGHFTYMEEGNKDKEVLKERLKDLIAFSYASLMMHTGMSDDDRQELHNSNLLKANTRVGLYIPAERNLAGIFSNSLASIFLNKIPFSDVLLEYMSIFEKAKKEYTQYEIPFLNVKYVKKNGQERIELIGKDKDLPLSACSSGVCTTLPMLMVLEYARKTDCFDSFVVEEPEQNLFPKNQRNLLHFFAYFMNSKRSEFVITTHSPYFLSCLNVLMLAYRLRNYEEVNEIVNLDYAIDPAKVAVYSLDIKRNSDQYCRSLISKKTSLISMNELDSVSEYIGEDYDRLYHLFLKTKKK